MTTIDTRTTITLHRERIAAASAALELLAGSASLRPRDRQELFAIAHRLERVAGELGRITNSAGSRHGAGGRAGSGVETQTNG